ncbi:hypothetical protein AN643_01795 [Candidatus Epulonipiscioides saccharophilum]|nr:hypothetical protein AN643_01795 [Epulopiscium sp. SCG-B10WGA-EpuloB]
MDAKRTDRVKERSDTAKLTEGESATSSCSYLCDMYTKFISDIVNFLKFPAMRDAHREGGKVCLQVIVTYVICIQNL